MFIDVGLGPRCLVKRGVYGSGVRVLAALEVRGLRCIWIGEVDMFVWLLKKASQK